MLHDAAVVRPPRGLHAALRRLVPVPVPPPRPAAERLLHGLGVLADAARASARRARRRAFDVLPQRRRPPRRGRRRRRRARPACLRGRRFLLAVAARTRPRTCGAVIEAFAGLADGRRCGSSSSAAERPGVRRDRGQAEATRRGVVRTGSRRRRRAEGAVRHGARACVPSLYEGFGLPALEAMTQGCAVDRLEGGRAARGLRRRGAVLRPGLAARHRRGAAAGHGRRRSARRPASRRARPARPVHLAGLGRAAARFGSALRRTARA